VPKSFLYTHTNIVTKKLREKNARNNFSRSTPIVRAKNVRKKIIGIKCEKKFFIITRISWPKMGWKKRAKQFFQNQTNRASKKVGKNCRKKVRINVFSIHTNIVSKKWGKNARNNFSRNSTNSASKICEEKNRREKVQKTFFYNHTNIVT